MVKTQLNIIKFLVLFKAFKASNGSIWYEFIENYYHQSIKKAPYLMPA